MMLYFNQRHVRDIGIWAYKLNQAHQRGAKQTDLAVSKAVKEEGNERRANQNKPGLRQAC